MYHVSQRKYRIDKHCPWWQRAFFRWIYLPFNRFAFKYAHIPALDEVEIDGRKLTFCWYEDEGIFDDNDRAEAACLGEFWRVKPMVKNRVYPPETAQRNGHRYPRAGKPDRYGKPQFALIIKDRKEDERKEKTLAEALGYLNQVLDRQ